MLYCARRLLLLQFAFLMLLTWQAPAKSLRLLAVGNSFSQNATKYLEQISKAGGQEIVIGRASIGGASMERHMQHINAYEADKNKPEGKPFRGKSLNEILKEQQWDIITIQQSSNSSFTPATYHPFGDQLIAYIQTNAPQAELLLHQTWAYREDFHFWSNITSADQMYEALRTAYDDFAKQYSLRIIPSGDAMQSARLSPKWGKFTLDANYDYKDPIHPNFPKNEKNSLHTGYRWSKHPQNDTYKLILDFSHANAYGCYLLGCVWYETLFGESVIGNSYLPKEIEAEKAAILQEIAHQVVTKKERP